MRPPKPEVRLTGRRGLAVTLSRIRHGMLGGLVLTCTSHAPASATVLTLDELPGTRTGLFTAAMGEGSSLTGAPGPAPTLNAMTTCAATPSERACWASMPALVAPNGEAIHFDDDLPGPGWPMAINLDTPVPPEAAVFSALQSADELPGGKTPNAGKQDKPDELQPEVAESSGDSWDYELLILLALGVAAIGATRLHKRRRGNRAKSRPRKRVRLRARL